MSLGGDVVDPLAAEPDLAPGGPLEARNGPQCRGLARAVGAQERDDRALLHLHRYPTERLASAVVHPQILDLKQHPASPSVPRYASITCGFVLISSGRPSAILLPWLITTIRSDTSITTSMACSTKTIVIPFSRICWMRADHLRRFGWVHAGHRLVQQQESGPACQRDGHSQRALVSVRKGAGRLILQVGQPHEVDDLERGLPRVGVHLAGRLRV